MNNLETAIQLSAQQQSVIDWVKNGHGHGLLKARAGSGKTFTLIQANKHMQGHVFLAAYNKAIQVEIAQKMQGEATTVATFHSLGFQSLKKLLRYPKVDERKHKYVFDNARVAYEYFNFSKKLISHAKNQGVGVLTPINSDIWQILVDKHSLDQDLTDWNGHIDQSKVMQAIETTKQLFRDHVDYTQQKNIIDFDDMIFLPLYLNAKFDQYDWGMIDEAQDSNPARRALAKRLIKADGRSLWVGDEYQAIYGFTGADHDSMDLIQSEFGCTVLKLNETRRCPIEVINYVHDLTPDIDIFCLPDAPKGQVSSAHLDDLLIDAKQLNFDKKACICRNSAPLVKLAYKLLKQQIPCHVEGRDLGQGLIKLIDRQGKAVKDIYKLIEKLDDYREKQESQLLGKGKEVAAQNLNDQVETIKVVADSLSAENRTIVGLKSAIESLFVDGADTFTLSTIHKSKGREWCTVYWLNRDLYQPSKYARQAWQQLQERNLIYVAATRSKDTLIDLYIDFKKGE